ncbi:hypothetical protein L4C33_12995, partial [Vibrio makurazakiensis]|uniref:hypothetical protein n=1 Tax=Vibrio makurazakiensis TaxID=2910250 RepID=UPI003D0B4327
MPLVTGYCAKVISIQNGDAVLTSSFTNENKVIDGKSNCDWSVLVTGSLFETQKQFDAMSTQSPVGSDYELTINP